MKLEPDKHLQCYAVSATYMWSARTGTVNPFHIFRHFCQR